MNTNTHKFRILTITTSELHRKEGISTIILDLYSYFNKEIFELDIIANNNADYDLIQEFINIGVNVRYIPSRKINYFKYLGALVRLLKNQNYDALYIHGSSAIMTVELLIAKLYGCKIRFVHSHNTTCEHKIINELLRPVFYHSYTKALACGKDAGEWLFGTKKFEIIKNGRNVETYEFDIEKRNEMRRALGLNPKTLAVGHVGNFNKQKNHEFLIKIFKALKKLNDNVKLYLMGDGYLKEDVKNIVSDYHLESDVIFTGMISNVPDMLQAMDVMVLPSLYEGFPLVAIEWQIAALPCVLSDNITKECAYTNLVHFCSLSDKPEMWANEILKYKDFDRKVVAEKCVELTKGNGYDVQENAERLQNIFLETMGD